MASLPILPAISARIDRQGRLIAADPPLLALQQQAGAGMGDAVAVPQLGALARLAMQLGVPIVRPVLAASDEEDLELTVRATPDDEGVDLLVEQWTARPPSRSRWSSSGMGEGAGNRNPAEEIVTDPALKILSVGSDLARWLSLDAAPLESQPLTRMVRPIEDEDGNLPLLQALAERSAFMAQPAELRGTDAQLLLDGQPRTEDGRFAGYIITVRTRGLAAGTGMPPIDNLLMEPLASIIGEAQQIADRSEGPLRNDYAGYGADIASAAQHLLQLLVALGPNAPAEVAPAGEKLDLAALVLEAAGLTQPQATARKVVLDVGGEGSLPIRGQSRAITQILVNLIGNAIRFSPEGATVTIQLETGEQASVTVTDSGPGVAKADRDRIFEPFEQAEPSKGGAGLGLAISRRLAREMGGEVALLDSAAGASFRLTLPRA